MMRKSVILAAILVAALYFGAGTDIISDIVISLTIPTGDSVRDTLEPKYTAQTIPVETELAPPEVYFCPRDNCGDHLVDKIHHAKTSVHCAFFDLNLEAVIDALSFASGVMDVRLVVDDHNYADVSHLPFAKKDNTGQLSHNKFCVFDNSIVWTGSFNPTHNGDTKNNNNVVVLYSKVLAANYASEFDELWDGTFGRGDLVTAPKVNLSGMIVENYFCPEDWCANKVIREIDSAEESVKFMTFSFTHDQLGDSLIRAAERGIDIEGVFERTQNNKYTEFDRLNGTGSGEVESYGANINVRWDNNKAAMHHKVFIIDNETIVTGSFNPSKNGDTRNDENIVIIHNSGISELFLEEFNIVWG